jgi:hypothetical protein
MKELIRKILKEERKPLKGKVIDMLYDVGYITTIQLIGGYKNFKKIVGDDYLSKERKIELIGDIAYQFGTREEIYLYEYGLDIMINKDTYSDGSFDATYVVYVDHTGNFYYKSYKFDKDGQMNELEFDEGYMPLSYISKVEIDTILEKLLHKFL